MNKYDIAIIGGGFSGMCLAAMLDQKKVGKVVILEANKRLGKKILVTGNGQGNITNTVMDASHYHGDREFASAVICRYGNKSLLEFFSSIGLLTAERDGKIYPASFFAGAVSDVLRFKLTDENIDIITEFNVINVTKQDLFYITDYSSRVILAKKVIFAFGGSSGDGFMTDGTSYKIARNLGHKITELCPSLVQLKTEREKIKGLKGVKQEATATLYDGQTKICTFSGDVLFTDFGISGNCTFYLSAYLKGLKNPCVKISFLPEYDEQKLLTALLKKAEKSCDYSRLLISVLPKNLSLAVLKCVGLKENDCASKQGILKIAHEIKNFTLRTEGTLGFKSSQVTAGGIDTKDIDVNTMESRIVSDLYIIGEALNVDGDCGGYNLQWAYSSAAVCAKALLG